MYSLLNFRGHTDGRGVLFSLEEEKNIPFQIKRVYYLTDLQPNHPRGFHAHKNLEQVAICVSGSCVFTLDNGLSRISVELNSPGQGLHIKGLIWREMKDFSNGCVIMVLANEYYDESDYIRDYSEFKRLSAG